MNSRILVPGIAYFAGMFALGFILGTIRVLALEPRLGAWPATAIELPLMLAASWVYCTWLVGRLRVPPAVGARIAMGLVALALLLAAELLLGVFGFGRSLTAQLAAMVYGPALAGVIGQILFGAFPLLQIFATR